MFTYLRRVSVRAAMLVTVSLAAAWSARADVVVEANERAAAIASENKLTVVAVRTMAIAQVSVFEAVNAITGRYAPYAAKIDVEPGASIDAAVASAVRTAFVALQPAQQSAIEADYEAALAKIPDGPAKRSGVAVGEQAARAILALRSDDGTTTEPQYRPHTSPGVYVPTTLPAVPHWGRRKPWLMTQGDQFRPGPPPSLTSETWARDFNEIKAMGGKQSTQRTPVQTDAARFWEATAPVVYWGVARSAVAPGREVTANARFLALAAMAMDDALIAVFDAKYAYHFWRPITAIRNADLDGNDATAPDPGWVPFIDTPMHPEYPCAHCTVSGALGAVIAAEIGTGPIPKLCCTSPTAPGAEHAWTSVGDFCKEVAEARICDGVHFRTSTEAGTALGTQVGELAAGRLPKASR